MVLTPTQEIAIHHDLDEQAKLYISKAKADNTKKAYQSDWKDFQDWCLANGCQSLPADPLTVVRYLTDRATNSWTKYIHKGKSKEKTSVTFSPLKPSSIDRKLVAISKAHQYSGLSFDRKNPILSETVAGIKREKGVKQDQKAPVMMIDIKRMVHQLDTNTKGIRDRALLLIGFVGALRRSEIVALTFDDIKFVKEGIEIHLGKSKTDQEGKGEILPIPYGSNIETCPVRAMQDWLEVSKIEQGPLFRAINKHGHVSKKGMCPASVAFVVKSYSPEDKKMEYSGHSLRAGFCTQAASNGVSDTQGMRHSRHKKFDTWKKYVRMRMYGKIVLQQN